MKLKMLFEMLSSGAVAAFSDKPFFDVGEKHQKENDKTKRWYNQFSKEKRKMLKNVKPSKSAVVDSDTLDTYSK